MGQSEFCLLSYCSASTGTVACIGLDGIPAIDLDVASAENQEFLSTRNGERREMIVLNDRLAVYIDKVRALHLLNSHMSILSRELDFVSLIKVLLHIVYNVCNE